MKNTLLIALAVVLLASVAWTPAATAGEGSLKGYVAARRAMIYPWHAGYYHTAWGCPVALVVPPTAENQTHWGWGVGNTRVTTIYHQFDRNFPGGGYYDRRAFRPTPNWPSDTDQFGVYYIRGPW